MSKPELLLHAYPKAWRDRYGEEFAALLADDIAERPRNARRDLDVVRAGLAARLASPATPLAALLLFAAATASIWTQLARGTSTSTGSHPGAAAATLGLVTLSICGLALAAVAIAATLGIGKATARTIRRGDGHRLLGPAIATLAGAATLAVGVVRIGGHAHAETAVSRWTWAATETISTYWVHPGRLLGLPAADLAWMLASPLAAVVCWRGLAALAARTGATATWHHKARPLIAAVLTPALVTAATWVIGSQHATNANLRAGTLDLALIAAMTAAVITIDAAARRHENSLA